MRRIRLRVAYDGTAYCGWQVQPEVPTIEGELNQAISRLTKEEIIVIGASRTDAGVHAKGNVAVFDTESTIPADRFAYALNPLLPEDIVVVASDEVEADWHPRYCDTEKTYEYKILKSKFPDPMRRRDTYHVSFDLDLEKMREAAGYLKGEHDFKSFCNVHTQVEDTVRTIYDLEVEKEGGLITIRVRGNGFLYNMVRILAGTLIGVGRGAIAPEQIPRFFSLFFTKTNFRHTLFFGSPSEIWFCLLTITTLSSVTAKRFIVNLYKKLFTFFFKVVNFNKP